MAGESFDSPAEKKPLRVSDPLTFEFCLQPARRRRSGDAERQVSCCGASTARTA